MAIDGVGWDWSYMANNEEDHALVADEESPTEFALMANTSTESKVFDNSLCSKYYKKNNDSLNSKITDLTDKLFDAKNMIYHYKLGLAQVESRLVEHKDREIKYCEKIRGLEFRTESNNECIEILKKKLEILKKEKEGVDGKLAGFLTASKDLDNLIESQRADKNKDGLGYSVVPPALAQIYSSPKKDLSWTGLPEFADDTVTDYSRPSPTMESTSGDDQNRNPSIFETEASPITITPETFIKFLKASDSPTESKIDKAKKAKKSPVKYAKQYRKTNKKPNVRGNQRNWNNLKSHQLGPDFVMKKKACFNCGDFNHLAYDCRKRVKRGTSRYQDNTHKSFTPRPVTHRPYRSPIRPVRTNMNGARPNITTFNKQAHSYANRPFQRTSAVRSHYRALWVPTVNRNFPPVNRKFSTGIRKFPTANRKFPTASRKFPTGSTKCSTADIGMKGKVIKPSAYSGCSRHMTCNISYLSDYKPFNEGYVSFGQGGCKITGKGTIKTSKLEFEIMYVKDLKYNLFSVSQICDDKNSVLFTDSECIVLGRDFKLLDDANILLRTPRQHNMYSINLNNIVPHIDLTCLVAKASVDECMLWHRRLGHLNFKTINKLVRHNLVRGLPTKCFENDHTCTACLKGKQHKASCKSKLVNSVTKPLHTLHRDLFGPTFVSSISHKWYCLVVTDDFSRFTWIFFLKTKDETSGILKKFITEIENLKDLKVKIIRCDNEGEFRNKEMNDFCSQKGIKREFSNARTPQQNGVAKRRDRTLIEAARIMVLVNKSYNKTPYELFNGKFEEKGDEGYFTGYSMSSKAFRVFNKRTRRVEENLHVEFLENKVIEKGVGPNWLFDIDSLTKSMNYVSMDAGTISTNLLGTKHATSQEVKKDVSSLRYIALPNWAHDALLEYSSSKPQDHCSTEVPEDHPKSQIIGPLDTPIQTRNKSKEVGEQSFIAIIHQKIDPVLLQFCLFLCFLSQVKPKKISDALQDPSWVEAMQEELLQFKIQNVWTLVDCPKGVRLIGTKWVLKNKKDERGIVIRNKAMLVAQGHTQEEGIDYNEVFALVARIEAIRLFLAYASFRSFIVYQMDVNSAFLYGTIDEEVYVMQPPGFQDPKFLAKVYKVENAMYELHQAPRAWQREDFILVQVYVDDIIFGSSNLQIYREFEALMHEKFQMSDMGKLNFFFGLQVLQKEDGESLGKDGTVKDVDLHLYRSMIGSLMYLTASRPDIMFVVCASARHHVTPKECHLHAVKRIFRYLKGHPKLGLWYPKESPFDLVAYSDSDYSGATQDRKSTTGGCQFLGRRISFLIIGITL
uniref:Uncharacterized protein n=1 Tax=Tanacetum cinerariifolium TaxID=118510 RepID=A0A699IHA7_TANCI|nr:hypothetical protein [Tanacetum cinerariifolium]